MTSGERKEVAVTLFFNLDTGKAAGHPYSPNCPANATTIPKDQSSLRHSVEYQNAS